MTPREVLYQRAQAVVHALLELPAGARQAALADACGADAELRDEVEWLLDAVGHDATNHLDDAPARVARDLLDTTPRIHAPAARDFRLLRRIGEGGMGQVWLAERDIAGVCQRVALKLLHGTGAPSARVLERFTTEARILARLQHPNIAHLIDVGRDGDGTPFIAMEYVEGERIDDWCNGHGADLRARIGLFLTVCTAVAHAHQHLVIHRDIKPANILVDAAGRPKLLDFGIAKLLATDTTATQATRAMTPAYASPEQIEGAPLGTATDVYSLGVVLYELLTGTRPFAQLASDHARANAILTRDATPPSRTIRIGNAPNAVPTSPQPRLRHIPADVDAIVLRALRREPGQRYGSVREFADDLQRFLEARPVLARRGRWTYRTRRFVQRNRWPLAALAVLVLIVAGFGWRIILAEQRATTQAEISGRVSDFLISVFNASDSNLNDGAHRDLTAIDVLDHGAARVQRELAGEPRIEARVLEAIANAYRHMNANAKAARLMRAAADLNLGPVVDDPLAASRCLEALANIMANGGFPPSAAESAARQSLRLAKRTTAPGSQEIANAWMVLSLAQNRSGNLDAALASAQRTQAMNLALQGHGQTRIQQAENNLCLILANRGDQPAARRHCQRKLELSGTDENISVTTTLAHLAHSWSRSADYERAEATIQRAIAMADRIEGSSGLFSISYRFERARILDAAGQYAQALPLLQQAATVRAASAGTNSHAWLDVRQEMARRLALLGQWPAAAMAYRAVLDARRRIDDPQDPALLDAETGLADAMLWQGQVDATTLTLLADADAGWRQKDFAPPASAQATQLALAHAAILQGNGGSAESRLSAVEQSPLHDVWNLSRVAELRAMLADRRGDEATALRQEQAAYELLRDTVGTAHPQVARIALALAARVRAAGAPSRANALELPARPIALAAFPQDTGWPSVRAAIQRSGTER